MRRTSVLFGAAMLASVTLASVVRAQDDAPGATGEGGVLPTDCPTAAAESQRGEAARLFGEAERDSAALRVAAAARSFACSHTLVATAQAAYNAGVAYEAIDQEVRARYWFQRYLEEAPDADDRVEVSARVAALDARIVEREAREQAARDAEARQEAEVRAEATAVAERDALARRPVASEPSQGLGTLGLVGIFGGSAGLAAAGTGLALYVVAGGLHDDFVTSGRTALSLARRGQALDLAASWLWIAGGTAALAGAALTLWDVLGGRDERAPTTSSIVPYLTPRMSGGAECGVAGVF